MYKHWFKAEAEDFIEDHLVEPLLHGDVKHRDWWKRELRKWIPDLAVAFERMAEAGAEEVAEAVQRVL